MARTPRTREIKDIVNVLNNPPTAQTSTNAGQAGAGSSDFTYNAMSVTLTPGTWVVVGSMGVNPSTTEAMNISLWNDTTGTEVPNSRCGTGGGSNGIPDSFTSSAIITVAVNTVIKIRAYRNGASVISAASALGPGGLPNSIKAFFLGSGVQAN